MRGTVSIVLFIQGNADFCVARRMHSRGEQGSIFGDMAQRMIRERGHCIEKSGWEERVTEAVGRIERIRERDLGNRENSEDELNKRTGDS